MPTFLPSWRPPGGRSPVDMREQVFRDEMFDKGMLIQWEMAAACPCKRRLTITATSGTKVGRTGETVSSCTECKGSGILYHSKQIVRGIVLGSMVKPERFRIYGEYADGAVRITLLGEHIPSFLDRFLLIEQTMVFREVRERKGTVEKLRYPIVPRNVVLGDATDETVQVVKQIGVLNVRKASSSGVVAPNEVVEGVDFTVTVDGKVDWSIGDAGGDPPAVGDLYSFHYYTTPVFIARSFPHAFRDTVARDDDTCSFGSPAPAPLPEELFRKDADGKPTRLRVRSLPVAVDCWLEVLGRDAR